MKRLFFLPLVARVRRAISSAQNKLGRRRINHRGDHFTFLSKIRCTPAAESTNYLTESLKIVVCLGEQFV